MEIEDVIPAQQTIESIPMVETEDELNQLLGEQPKAGQEEDDQPVQKPKSTAKANIIGDDPLNQGPAEEDDGQEDEQKENTHIYLPYFPDQLDCSGPLVFIRFGMGQSRCHRFCHCIHVLSPDRRSNCAKVYL
jgi:hypothetical protein